MIYLKLVPDHAAEHTKEECSYTKQVAYERRSIQYQPINNSESLLVVQVGQTIMSFQVVWWMQYNTYDTGTGSVYLHVYLSVQHI